MQSRPTFIDLRSKSSDSIARAGFPSPRSDDRSGQPSPRMQHLAGDVPPAMSPLDMFAMHSRMLAKQLDESQRDGRRVSRLPPLSIDDPIAKQQQNVYDRSRSADAKKTPPVSSPKTKMSPRAREEDTSGFITEVEEPQFRPKSFYPRMSTVPPVEDEDDDGQSDVFRQGSEDQAFHTPMEHSHRPHGFFEGTQTKSPDSIAPNEKLPDTDRNHWVPPPPRPQDIAPPFSEPQRGFSAETSSSKSYSSSLAPPNPNKSPHNRQSPSIRSIPQDSSDDELSASTGGSGFSRQRKLSSSSNVSMPHSPFSPFAQAHARSPSLNSEYSLGGSRQPRPTFNFSRPLSRSSRPSLDVNSRQPSFDSRPSFDAVRPPFSTESRKASQDSARNLFVDETVQTPVTTDHEGSPVSKDAPAPSYIYAKYSLPRGRVIQRDSKGLDNNQIPLFEWERPLVRTNVRPTTPLANRPLSPPQSPRFSPKPSAEFHRSSPRPSFEQRRYPSPRPSTEQSKLNPQRPPATPVMGDDQSEYSASTRSGSTIKASARLRQPAHSTEVTPEDHLAKGISLHERGEIQESTYHLRIAAKHNLPTAMLLYALACRHGWGMRPNPQEGAAWLRKAADCASLEIATDEDNASGDALARRQRKAQFAYAIYELGVSHMNGLGLEQDRTLALRCFEIAASWGDADAMAESGFCYAEGQGCKKDLKKAAKYYKMAEKKGVSMVGNSWYVHSPIIPTVLRLIVGDQDPQVKIQRRRRQAPRQYGSRARWRQRGFDAGEREEAAGQVTNEDDLWAEEVGLAAAVDRPVVYRRVTTIHHGASDALFTRLSSSDHTNTSPPSRLMESVLILYPSHPIKCIMS